MGDHDDDDQDDDDQDDDDQDDDDGSGGNGNLVNGKMDDVGDLSSKVNNLMTRVKHLDKVVEKNKKLILRVSGQVNDASKQISDNPPPTNYSGL